MELETLKVCIDGCDCSGKTTLWNAIHKASNYRWKLEDRSFVTMVVYAMLHGRKKASDYERQLTKDLSNLNNKYVLFNPPWEVIEQRYNVRGDDLHSFDDLKKIHAIYGEVIQKISKFPNVLVLDGSEDAKDSAIKVDEWLKNQDTSSLEKLTRMIQERVSAAPGGEVSPLTFSFLESGTYPQEDEKILDIDRVKNCFPAIKPATVVEFNKMVEDFMSTIDKELRGENMYNLPQTLSSRRFIFTQDACVSFIQAMFRDGMFKFYVTCRSSHVFDVFPADLRLMYHMCSRAHKKLGLDSNTGVLFEFQLNSAHAVA
jgi:thymidylate kinase